MDQHYNDKDSCWELKTNADSIWNMSKTELANRNVYRVTISLGCRLALLFITSDGFQSEDKEEAIEHELNWLEQPISKKVDTLVNELNTKRVLGIFKTSVEYLTDEVFVPFITEELDTVTVFPISKYKENDFSVKISDTPPKYVKTEYASSIYKKDLKNRTGDVSEDALNEIGRLLQSITPFPEIK